MKNSIFNNRKIFLRKISRIKRGFVKHWFRILSLVAICLFLLMSPGTSYYETLQLEPKLPQVRASEFDNFKMAPYPQKIGDEQLPGLTAESVVISDFESAVPMLELNPTERLKPASITKLMTALVAIDYFNLDQILTVQRLSPIKDEADMGLVVGDKITVKNLLYGLLVPSGNDAAYTLADNFPGGIENFIFAMNQKAKNLHMVNSHFENPSGFDSEAHFTTAHDLTILAREALQNDLISKIVNTPRITISDSDGTKNYPVRNVNQLLGFVYGVDGVKTGFTDEAGQCLITSVSRNNHRIIIVLLKSQDRFTESARLIEWTFRNFRWINPEESLPAL